MGTVASVTTAVGAAALKYNIAFAAWSLIPIWFLAFCYLTEKRFVILRNASYLRDEIEPKVPGLNWETHLAELSKDGRMRPALPFDPYHLELMVCSIVIVVVPFIGLHQRFWSAYSVEFIAGMAIFLVFLLLSIRSLSYYGDPQRYSAPEDLLTVFKRSVSQAPVVWLLFMGVWLVVPSCLVILQLCTKGS